MRLAIVAVAGIVSATFAIAEDPAEQEAGQETVTFDDHVAPFFAEYCTGCHGSRGRRKPKAGIALDAFEDASWVVKERKAWQRVLAVLLEHEMPPEKKDQPSELERGQVADWVRAELAKFDCDGPVDPGSVTLRRLNRLEYNNTVRDLFGIDLRPADQFPADEVGYGFDNIGDVLSLPPLLAEKYLDAAEQVVERALELDGAYYFHERFQAETLQATADNNPFGTGALSINKDGAVFANCEFPEDGHYILRTRAFAQQAGPDPARLAIRVDGQEVARFDVHAVESGPEVYETRVRVAAGERRLAIEYLNNYFNQDDPDPKLRGDRNLIVDWFEAEVVRGEHPGDRVGRRPQIFSCRPVDLKSQESCAREILSKFASRAFRTPVRERELDGLVALVVEAVDDGDSFEEGIGLAIQAILVSPRFLFHVEEDLETEAETARQSPQDAATIVARPLDDFELASRLSYFLWSSLPDDELFRLASEGRLRDETVLEAETQRMLADPRSIALVDSFASQWLQTRLLDDIEPDPALFPRFDEELRRTMKAETLKFFEAVLREDRSVLEFLAADFTFLNERLAEHYGIEGVEGDVLRRVSLEGGARGGVLTQASILTLTSNPTRTSPVKRGKWILEQIFGTPPPPPPPDVEELSEDQEAILSGSLRQRLEKHREDPNCGICHDRMDPIGFAFENFDAVGAWRDFDGNFLIDPSGVLPDGRKFDGPAGLKKILLGQKELFARNLAEKMLTYALGRGLEYYDKCAVDQVVESLSENGYKFSSLISGVVKTDPFRKRRGPTREKES